MIELEQEAVAKVVAALPASAVRLLQDNHANAIVAGGFVRDTLRGAQPSDIDIFTTAQIGYNVQLGILRDIPASIWKPPTFAEWRLYGILPIQIIYASQDHVETTFDFTICCARVGYSAARDCWRGDCHEQFQEDLRNRTLRLLGPERIRPRKTLKRVMRFVREGFTLQDGDLAAIVAATVAGTKHAGKQFVDETTLREELVEMLAGKAITVEQSGQTTAPRAVEYGLTLGALERGLEQPVATANINEMTIAPRATARDVGRAWLARHINRYTDVHIEGTAQND
jgi:hypothetical protein